MEEAPNVSTASASAEASLIELSIESWKFSRLFARVLEKIEPEDGMRYFSQLRYFRNRIESNLSSSNLKFVNLEGMPFDSGMAASSLNMDEFSESDNLVVDQMVEPIVMGPDGLKREGVVILKKGE